MQQAICEKYAKWKESRKASHRVPTEQAGGQNIGNLETVVNNLETQKLDTLQPLELNQMENQENGKYLESPQMLTVYSPETKEKAFNFQEVKKKKRKATFIESFLENQFNNFVFKGRYFIIIGFVCWTVICIIFTSKLSAPSELPNFLPTDNLVQKARDSLTNFASSDNSYNLQVKFVWGIEDIDQSNLDNIWDPLELGDVIYDSNFKLSPVANQEFLYNTCLNLSNTKRDFIDNSNIDCFMLNFKLYLDAQNIDFPIKNENQFNSQLKDFFETSQGGTYYTTQQIGYSKEGNLQFVSISLPGTIQSQNPRKILLPYYEKFDELIEQFNQQAPSGLTLGFQISQSWLWMESEKVLIDNAISGMVLSISIAFIILILSSTNIVMAFYATLTMIGIVLSVLACIYFRNWKFNIQVSINAIMIIGLSVDYVVHLCHCYLEAKKCETRFYKTKKSLKHIGKSIFGGALTTLGAGLFLFGGKITFFEVMAFFVCLTITFSVIWSFVFFSGVTHIIGIQGEVGNVFIYAKRFIKWCKIKCNKGKEQTQE